MKPGQQGGLNETNRWRNGTLSNRTNRFTTKCTDLWSCWTTCTPDDIANSKTQPPVNPLSHVSVWGCLLLYTSLELREPVIQPPGIHVSKSQFDTFL